MHACLFLRILREASVLVLPIAFAVQPYNGDWQEAVARQSVRLPKAVRMSLSGEGAAGGRHRGGSGRKEGKGSGTGLTGRRTDAMERQPGQTDRQADRQDGRGKAAGGEGGDPRDLKTGTGSGVRHPVCVCVCVCEAAASAIDRPLY